MPNAFTGTDAPPNEQESAVLRMIAQLRAAGVPDDDIFNGFLQGGGSGYLPYIGEMAGIQSSYNLGRGNLAQNAQDAYYKQMANPYNVVTALQYQRDNPSASGMLTDPTLGSIQPSGGGIYSNYINGLLNAENSSTNPAGGGSSPTTTAPAGGASPQSYYGFRSPEEAMAMRKYFDRPGQYYGFDTPQIAQEMAKYFAAGGPIGNQQPDGSQTVPVTGQPTGQVGTTPLTTTTPRGTMGTAPMMTTNTVGAQPAQPAQQPTNVGQSWVDAWRDYHPGEPDPVAGYATSAMNTGAQQAGARLLGSSLNGVGVGGGFRSALDQGKVPGFNQLNERQMGLMSPDQQSGYLGLVGTTGRVSDPAQAYRQFLSTYSHR